MEGHKGELFVLDLTFAGWQILASICFNLGFLFVNPYQSAARAAFYRNLVSQEAAAHVTYTTEM